MTVDAAFQPGEGRLDFGDRGRHGASVRCGGFVELGLGQCEVALQPRALKRRRQQVQGQILKPLVGIEHLVGVISLQADIAGEGQRRQQFRAPRADHEPRGLHPLARRADVGPLREQVDRHARRHGFHRP